MTSRWLICFNVAVLPLCAATVSGHVELRDSRDPAVRNRKDYSGVVIALKPLDGATSPAGDKHSVMLQKDKTFSPEAEAVLAEGKKLWQAFFAETDVHTVRDELKLNRPDVGWYQIRKALQARNESDDFLPVSFKDFEGAYKALTEKLQPMVYELGFLKA